MKTKNVVDKIPSNIGLSGVVGGVAGLMATVPMTLFMLAAHKILPVRQRDSLPPRKITMRIARKLGFRSKLTRKKAKAATLATHFGYGASTGSLYGSITDKVDLPPITKGIGFGLLVWFGSYFGWLPSVNLWEPEEEQPERYWMMALAHVVWGAFLAIGYEELQYRTTKARIRRSSE